MFPGRNKVIGVCNNISLSKWRQKFHFWLKYSLKSLPLSQDATLLPVCLSILVSLQLFSLSLSLPHSFSLLPSPSAWLCEWKSFQASLPTANAEMCSLRCPQCIWIQSCLNPDTTQADTPNVQTTSRHNEVFAISHTTQPSSSSSPHLVSHKTSGQF